MKCPECGKEFEYEWGSFICPYCSAKFDEDDIEYECPFCGAELDAEDRFYECPECGADTGEGVFYCEYCESYIDWDGTEWECEDCGNEEITVHETVVGREIIHESIHCPECGAEMDDDGYCDVCGWPNNQGWIGENC